MLLFKTRPATLLNFKRFACQIIYNEHGNPTEVLSLCGKEFDFNNLENNQVYVKWLASPINPADINQIQGVYPLKPSTFPAVGGNEGCAKIIKVGRGVKDFKYGDLVIPSTSGLGTWCTNGIYDSKALFKVHANPEDFIFLSIMLKDFVHLSPGDLIVQNGANSAVGHFVIQLCRIYGLKSINVVRDRPEIDQLKKHLEEIGADEVYTEKEFLTSIIPKKIKAKLALNCVGGTSGMNLSRALEYGGTMVTYGGMSKGPVQVATSSLIFANIKSVGFWMSSWYGLWKNKEEREHMYKELIDWYKAGNLTLPKYEIRIYGDYREAIKLSIQTDDPQSAIKPKQILKNNEKGNGKEFNKTNKKPFINNNDDKKFTPNSTNKDKTDDEMMPGIQKEFNAKKFRNSFHLLAKKLEK